MSRIGRKIIALPKGVSIIPGETSLRVKGPKGELAVPLPAEVSVSVNGTEVSFTRSSETKRVRALHGLTRALTQNCVTGLSEGFTKKLTIVGVGYKAELRGKSLVLALGYSHPIVFMPPPDITITVPVPTAVVISGADRQVVGQVAANLRGFRPPEPYNGKGVKYEGEIIRRKAGKAAAK
jgi:large subunit ribosomal protein L6